MQHLLAQTEQGSSFGYYANMANRYGLIAGADIGTGKTVTLRKIVESFSDSGVPVFLVDVKSRPVRFSLVMKLHEN